MRAFEVYDSTKRRHKPVATLYCDDGADGKGKFRIVVGPDVRTDELPLMLALLVEQGKRDIPDKWARKWVEERIPPQGRQNLGEILRANGLDEYDEAALLAASEGRSAQDDFLLREVALPRVDYALVSLEPEGNAERQGLAAAVGASLARCRKAAGMTQRDLSEKTGIDQAAVSRIEAGRANPTLSTLEALAEGVGATLGVVVE